MNEVSIIINGTRYDAVDATKIDEDCDFCDLSKICCMFNLMDFCSCYVNENRHFKKSTKSFEP